ncbi:hypothetical protein FACS1894109_18220 [Spirochaetia bacterium]|nr:hypothetical protein FACS1894109_18220 [Spirochaetia bacterium]
MDDARLKDLIAKYKKWGGFKKTTCLPWYIQKLEKETPSKAAIPGEITDFCNKEVGKPWLNRIRPQTLRKLNTRLQKALPVIVKAADFDALMKILHAQRVPGIGEVNLYALALLIGFHLDLEPEYIYLHGGAWTGFRNLCGEVSRCVIHTPYGKKIKKVDLPRSLANSGLTCIELEDFFCWAHGRVSAPEGKRRGA